MEIKLSKETVEAVLTLITQDPHGTAGLLVGQDLTKLNVPERTENDILEESQAKRAEGRKDEDG